MTLVTVVEACGLSGLPPDAIHSLIEGGRLRAFTVPLDHGPAYLIESGQLDLVAQQRPAELSPLAEALAGLQAALARRHVRAEARADRDDEGEGPRPRGMRPRRTASGLSERELLALAARVDRLFGP